MSRLEGFSNDALLNELRGLVQRDQVLEAELVSYLGEVDARRLYLGRACSSMFSFCVDELGFAEGVAYKRIAVARASRRFPALLRALEVGSIHLTGACLIAPHLERDDVEEWLALARGSTATEIKMRIADKKPKVEPKTSVRRISSPVEQQRILTHADCAVPTMKPSASNVSALIETQPAIPSVVTRSVEPLGAGRYNIRFVAGHETHDQLEELRALMRHSIPDGDVAKILARAVDALLEKIRKQKIGAAQATRSGSGIRPSSKETPARKIPTAIRRAVWARDRGKCTYRSSSGKRCNSRDYLEFHHQVPWAHCRVHEESNIFLRCRAHNQYEAELVFGASKTRPPERARGNAGANARKQIEFPI